MAYSFTDLGAEGCCHSLNALFTMLALSPEWLLSHNVSKAFKITKDIYTKLQKMYPDVFKGELMCSFKRNKNLGHYLVLLS